ncbi:hypothetical protein P5673_026696 [Acropora cervicornis]|uniref:Uncharacterized protein n=1 Tax=Acropora cervicornis TaxID=6130 RepID=A0AAD9UW55_ACRCE|nr:hypothetical protein P5673_026696 [Acropora cervicornis]
MVKVPASTGRMPKKIMNSYGGFTADQWKSFTVLFSIYALWNILPKSDLELWWDFLMACSFLSSPVLTEAKAMLAHSHLLKFCKCFEEIYGKDKNCYAAIFDGLDEVSVTPHFDRYACCRFHGDLLGFTNSRGDRSALILARWSSLGGSIDTSGSDLRPGVVDFFIKQNIKVNGQYVLCVVALGHLWKCVAGASFEPEGDASFIPVQRVHGKFIPAYDIVAEENVLVWRFPESEEWCINFRREEAARKKSIVKQSKAQKKKSTTTTSPLKSQDASKKASKSDSGAEAAEVEGNECEEYVTLATLKHMLSIQESTL